MGANVLAYQVFSGNDLQQYTASGKLYDFTYLFSVECDTTMHLYVLRVI